MARSNKTGSISPVDNYGKPGIYGLIEGFWRADQISFERPIPKCAVLPFDVRRSQLRQALGPAALHQPVDID